MPAPDYQYTSGVEVKFPKAFRWITVEPPVFFFGIAIGMVLISNGNLYVERTCLQGSSLFGNGTTFNDTICENLENHDYMDEENYVEYQVSRLNYLARGFEAILAIFFTVFAGAWSDIYGRRFLILFPLIGFVIRDAIFLIISQFDTMKPDFILIEALQAITGGLPVLMLGAFSHLADLTTIKSRTSRMAVLEAFYLLGLAIGTALSRPLFGIGGYAPAYIMALVLIASGMLSIPFFVKKPKIKKTQGAIIDATREEVDRATPGGEVLSDWTKFKAFFKWSNVKSTFHCGFKSRENGKRSLIWLTLLCFGLIEYISGVERVVDTVYIREKFNPYEDYDDFANWWRTFYTIYVCWGLFNMMVMVPVLKQIYHMIDPTILIFSISGTFLRTLTFILASERDNLYIGSFLDMFNLAGLVICRSALVSLVQPGEYGKVLALSAIMQEIMAVLSPVTLLVHEISKDYYVSLTYCIMATLLILMAFISGYIYHQFSKYRIQEWPRKEGKKIFGGRRKNKNKVEVLEGAIDTHNVHINFLK